MSIMTLGSKRRTIRAPSNPLDKATVVSIYPKQIIENKPTIQPGRFVIEKGSYDNPSILVVGPSSWWREIDDQQPLLEIPTSSITIADSIVKDYSNGLVGCNMSNSMPGLFFIPGVHSVDSIKKNNRVELDLANTKQTTWYQTLVKLADVMWARSNGNPLSVSDDARLAAKQLNLDDKPWLKDFKTMERIPCKACGTLNNDTVVVCPNCKVILNPEKFKLLGLSFASQ